MTSAECAPAGSLDHVVRRMREIGGQLPPRDGLAVFNDVYLSVTEELARRVAAGWFADPATAGALGARFGELYLVAVDTVQRGLRPSACWWPLFQARRHPGIHAVQFALAGINAHIAHDLPVAVAATCRERGLTPQQLEGDYQRVDDILCDLEERVREQLMPGPDVLDVADPLTHLAGCWSLERARDGAWAAARVLWTLRDLSELREEFTERLDQSAGLVGRCLLTPLGGGPRFGHRGA